MNRQSPHEFDAASIAAAFVEARLAAKPMDQFPGPIPANLTQSYLCQDTAIGLWPDVIAGWKIGKIAPELASDPGVGRLAGPIFSRLVLHARPGHVVDFPMIEGGFCAVEAEYVLRLGVDAPAGRTDWTRDDAIALVDAAFVGVETAASPLSGINALGPTVVAADFGNNAGLILGSEITDWREDWLESRTCQTEIDGALVGEGGALTIPGGPFEALRFLLELAARRGRPLKAGDLISTGAATGIHDIQIGQTAVASFGRDGIIECRAVKAETSLLGVK
ncbi:2-keto-4-pentenoate hydratase [soil metagenome]